MGAILKPKTRYSYGDYLQWGDDERWEIIEGEAISMIPAPVPLHQQIQGEIYRQISTFLKGKKCKVFLAPCDVLLPEKGEADEHVDTVVQPDVFVVCDGKKIALKNIRGAPDLIFEILSPHTSRKDQTLKKKLYEKHGVKEYCIAFPQEKILQRFVLKQGKYGEPEIFTETDKLALKTLPKFSLRLVDVFNP